MSAERPTATYTHGHAAPVLQSHRWRTVENSAAYLIGELRPGVSVLDVGCGPGTITADLAARVAPGPVLGIDPAAEVIDAAARDHHAEHLTFQAVDVHDLDPAEERFDVVHAHQVLQHVADPAATLAAMRALCRPGGVVAARDADYAAMTWWPDVAGLHEWLAIYRTVARSDGGEPDAGRRLKSWALAAGFETVTATASTWCFTEPEDREWWSATWAERITSSRLASRAVEIGAATPADLERCADAWHEWAAAADAWFLVPHGEVLVRG